jgi:ABC-type amino acid transport substrate-binding protein
MTPVKTILTAALTSIVCFSVLSFVFPVHKTVTDTAAPAVAKTETAYDRVMRTKTLRCGYALWPALVEKDPNTGALSGIFVDYLNELGKLTDLKIEWTTEVGFGDMVEALRVGRVDAVCSGIWTNAQRGLVIDFTIPIMYQGISAFVRADDMRFDNNLAAINDPAIKLSIIEGSSEQVIASSYYPKAQAVTLPQLTDASQSLLNVKTGKADVIFIDRYSVGKFLVSNPGALREVPAQYPLSLFGNVIGLNKGEYALKQSLDNATVQLMNIGTIETILKKYETYPGSIYRAALPYINQ